MSIYDELEELVGRLTALTIKYQDFNVRLNDSIETYKRALSVPNPQLLAWMGADMVSIQEYLKDCYDNVPEIRRDVKPILSLLQGLTEPI